jgi:hypothetical protein
VARFYHVDRRGTLTDGAVIDLVQHKDVQPDVLQQHLDRLFPGGVTGHGNQYFVGFQIIGPIQEPAIELLFEYVRRAEFPDRPSRFESGFAFDTVEGARRFRGDMGAAGAAIWEVEAESAFQADMNYLKLVGASALTVSYFAHRYWSGESSAPESAPEPYWEQLLAPPVKAISRVPEPT